jgi:ABC-type anion transport system duplicated permease subunit
MGKLTLTLLSIRGFNDVVNLTGLNLPSGVTLQFSPATVRPSGTTQVTVAVSETAAVGNFTITLLGVSGQTIHTVSFLLLISAGPIQAVYVALSAAAAIMILLAVTMRRRRKRSRKRAAVEELLRASEADQGYVATARVIARLEELRATNQVDEATYQKLKKEYEKRLEKSK